MDQSKLPLVSIIITSYNRAHCIFKAIESALAQDYPNLEIIVSDNNSTDNSMEVINRYAQDPRMKISRNEVNIGMTPNFRKATWELIKGDYVSYISSDDYFCDDSFISDAISLAFSHENVVIVFGKLRQVTTSHEIIGETDEKPFWLNDFLIGKEVFLGYTRNSWLSFAACVLRRKELMSLKPFEHHHMANDIEINLKLLLMGNACFVNRFCYEQLVHFKNASLSVDPDKRIWIVRDCFEEVYRFAVSKFPSEKRLFDKWLKDVLTIYFKQVLILLRITNKKEFKILFRLVKEHYGDIYKDINKDPRWKLMNVLYHPAMFPLLKVFSPKRYDYFKKRTNSLS